MSFHQIYIKSSIHVALAVTSLSTITYLEFNRAVSAPLLLFTFFSTVLSYNAIKYLPVYDQLQNTDNSFLKFVSIVSVISLISLCASLLFLDLSLLPAMGFIGIITAAYVLPVNRRFKNLRQVYGFKIFVIGLVWASVTVLLPLLEADMLILNNSEAITSFIQRLLFVIALTIPFDIRDKTSDPENLGTLPMILGTHKAVGLGILFLLGVTFIEIFFRSDLNTSPVIFSIVICLIGILLLRSARHQSPWLASFWIEGIPILWVILYLLATL